MYKRTLIIVAIFSIITAGCVQEKASTIAEPTKVTAIDINDLWKCQEEQNAHSSQIVQNIEGTWVWQKVYCGWDTITTSADKQVVINFNDGGRYRVFENSTVSSEGEWTLVKEQQDGWWRIETEKPSTYVNGLILLCNDELVFYNSYVDGCDYYFTRQF